MVPELSFGKVLDLFKDKTKHNQIIIDYLRLYTNFVRAEDEIAAGNMQRAVHILMSARNMAKAPPAKEEEVHFERLRKLAGQCIADGRKKKSENYKLLTQLQLAQNICILRLLKRE